MKQLILILLIYSMHGGLFAQGGCNLLNLVKKDDVQVVADYLKNTKRASEDMDCFRSGEWLSPLMVAVRNDNLEMVKLLLNYGADMNKSLSNQIAIDHTVSATMKSFLQETGSMGQRLIQAVRDNDEDKVDKLLGSSMVTVTSRDDQHYSAIAAAAEEGHTDMIQKLLKLGSPVDYPYKAYHDDKTPLQLASEKGHLESVKVLVEAGADLEGHLKTGWTPLMLAIQYNFPKIAKYLIEKGANMNLSVYHGSEPYSLAAYRNEFDLLKYMLDKKPVSKTDIKHGIIAGACYAGNHDMFTYLIERGYKPVMINPYKGHNLLIKAAEGGSLPIVKALVGQYNFDVNSTDEYKVTPLTAAAAHNESVDIVKYLLESGADIDKQGHAGYPAISRAVNKPKVLEYLLEQGANPNAPSIHQTPLETACSFNSLPAVKLLVKYGADIYNARACGNNTDPSIKEYIEGIKQAQQELAEQINSENGKEKLIHYIKNGGNANTPVSHGMYTPLVEAIQKNDLELAKELIKLGANVNLESKGLTPLTAAIKSSGGIPMLDLLIENGAIIERTENYYSDPLGAAILNKNRSLVDFLLDKELDIDYRFKDSSTVMHAAAQSGNLALFKLLVERGGDPHAQNERKKTPFIIAVYHGDLSFTQYMVEELNADINQLSTNGAATAIKNATWRNQIEKVKYLLDHGADPYLTLDGQEDAIQYAFQNTHIDSLYIFYVEQGYQLKAQIGSRHNVFENMQKAKLEDRIIYAIEKNIVPDGFDTTFAVYLMYNAIMKRDTVFCNTLLSYGADINAKTQEGSTLLYHVQDHGPGVAATFTDYLLRHGAKPNSKQNRNEMPVLARCFERMNKQAAEVLLKNGADPNQTDKFGQYAWNYMKLIQEGLMPVPGDPYKSRNTDMLRLFKSYGADLTLKNTNDGSTAIFPALANADLPCVKYLHEKIGLGVNDSTKYGNRPLFQCLQTKGYTTYSMEMPVMNGVPFQEETFRYLLKQGADPDFNSIQCRIYNYRSNQANNFIFYCAYANSQAFDVLLEKIDPNMVANGQSLVSFLAQQTLIKPLEKVLKKGGKVVNPTTGKSALDIARSSEIKSLLEKYK